MKNSQYSSSTVVVVGSGLAALATIRSLVDKGVRPIVLDVGNVLGADLSERATFLSKMSPSEWKSSDRNWLNSNFSVNSSASIPKKLIYGSDFFYGKDCKEAPIKHIGDLPPFSYALGGLSNGWGAAVLPPHVDDLKDWPIPIDHIHRYCSIVLNGIPYSAVDDGLSMDFPLLSNSAIPVKLNSAGSNFLNWLSRITGNFKGEFLFGQSRLLVRSRTSNSENGCHYCGQCSSGCVYDSIYKASDEINIMRNAGLISYIPNIVVVSIKETSGRGVVNFIKTDDPGAQTESMNYDKLFLAAGAVNSTRIVMNSFDIYDRPVQLKTRGGFVLPVASFRSIERDWPNCNTQPECFIELKPKGEHWVHCQVSLENELVRQKLGVDSNSFGFLDALKSFLFRHLFIVLVNYHSDHSGIYELKLVKNNCSAVDSVQNLLISKQKSARPSSTVLWKTMSILVRKLFMIGCFPLFPLAKLNSGSYHVGCTLPMSESPKHLFESDLLGRVGEWKNTHIVDSSISLPGTTIGLLIMANAWRIVDSVYHQEQLK